MNVVLNLICEFVSGITKHIVSVYTEITVLNQFLTDFLYLIFRKIFRSEGINIHIFRKFGLSVETESVL